MATAPQSAVIQRVDKETQDGVSRDCADTQRQNIANHDEEVALVFAAKRGDGQAFEVLIRRYQRRTLAVVRRFTRIQEDAEDIVQQSFQKAFVHLQTFEGKSSFSTWLTRIAINEALMLLRRDRGHREVPINDLSGSEETAFRLEIPIHAHAPRVSFYRASGTEFYLRLWISCPQGYEQQSNSRNLVSYPQKKLLASWGSRPQR